MSLPTRRGFGQLALASFGQIAQARRRNIPVALQLFSVRRECEHNLPAALDAVRKMGYRAAEFAGFYGHGAAEVRRMLDNAGLPCCGSHTPLAQLSPERRQATADFSSAIGNRNLIVPGLPASYASPEGWKRAADLFNEISESLRHQGLRVGYHNHAIEFQPAGPETPWDILLENTRTQVIAQLDLGNARIAGADPVAVLKRYPGRAKSIHIKDYLPGHPDALLGESDFDWPALLRVCESKAGTEWYIVEHEAPGVPGLVGARQSLERFHRILAQSGRQ